MAQPTMVQANIDKLEGLSSQTISLLNVIIAKYGAIDRSLEELKKHWVGDKRDELYKKLDETQAEKEKALKAFESFCNGALSAVPKEYGQLEATIAEEAKKLKNGQM